MKIFDFLVKIAIFGAFESRVTATIERWFRAVTRDANLSIEREMLQKWLFWLKNQKFS